jgi:hypothetical protein
MINDNTKKTFDPKWYEITGCGSEYGWFESREDAKRYEKYLNAGKEYDLCDVWALDITDFRKIAAEQKGVNEDELTLSDTECEKIAEEWLQDVCVMTSEDLPEYLQRN